MNFFMIFKCINCLLSHGILVTIDADFAGKNQKFKQVFVKFKGIYMGHQVLL